MTENNQIIAINFNEQQVIKTLRETVANGLTDSEFQLFAEHCKATGLNPFKREVWAIKAGNRLHVMTGINGFLAIANKNPMYDGMEVEVDNDERPTKAICKVYRKDRKFPAIGVALLKEYKKATPIWDNMPRVMLTKVAKSIALREAFPQELNGLYTVEEMPVEYGLAVNERQKSVKKETPVTIEQESHINPPIDIGEGFFYDISSIEADKHSEAIDYLLSAGATYDYEREAWFSKEKLKRLTKYQVRSK